MTGYLSFFLLFGVLHIGHSHRECPHILSRSTWKAADPTSITKLRNPVDYVVIHHTAGPDCQSRNVCSSFIKSYQRDHMTNKNPPWDDIGYNYIISSAGEVYEGRGWETRGAHAPGYNSKSIGIVLIGNFMDIQPTEFQLNATKELIKCAVSLNKLKPNYKLLGHRQVILTHCPGSKLFNIIKSWPRWAERP